MRKAPTVDGLPRRVNRLSTGAPRVSRAMKVQTVALVLRALVLVLGLGAPTGVAGQDSGVAGDVTRTATTTTTTTTSGVPSSQCGSAGDASGGAIAFVCDLPEGYYCHPTDPAQYCFCSGHRTDPTSRQEYGN